MRVLSIMLLFVVAMSFISIAQNDLSIMNASRVEAEAQAHRQKPELFAPKDEFEKSGHYEARVRDGNLLVEKLQRNAFERMVRIRQTKIRASENTIELKLDSLGEYNADYEVFPVVVSGMEGSLKIAQKYAKRFKERMGEVKIKGRIRLNDDLIDIRLYSIEAIDPTSKLSFPVLDWLEPAPMVLVEGGTFQMGNNSSEPDENPKHLVELPSFWIQKYEVTQQEWEKVMGENPSNFKGAKHPVENVNWKTIHSYIKILNEKTKKNYRLPTEAEWEYAARGGNKSKGYIYSGSDSLDEVGWFFGNTVEELHDVGLKKSNELGIFDMSGNVWEWCEDTYSEDFYKTSPKKSPLSNANIQYRVLRGGYWGNYANCCRVTNRYYSIDDGLNGNHGFRLVLDAGK